MFSCSGRKDYCNFCLMLTVTYSMQVHKHKHLANALQAHPSGKAHYESWLAEQITFLIITKWLRCLLIKYTFNSVSISVNYSEIKCCLIILYQTYVQMTVVANCTVTTVIFQIWIIWCLVFFKKNAMNTTVHFCKVRQISWYCVLKTFLIF